MTTLKKWAPSKEPIPFSSMIIASRRSGKSYLIKHLFTKFWAKKFDIVIVMCPTNFEGFYEEFIFGDFFFKDFDADFLENVMRKQEQREIEGKKSRKILVILDDCSDDGEKYSRTLQKIYTKGRHYNISVVFSTQATTLTSTIARNNSDFIIIGKMMGGSQRAVCVDNFLLGLADEDELKGEKDKIFCNRLVKKYTANHNFLVVTFASDTNDFYNTVCTYRVNEKVKSVKKIKEKKLPEDFNEGEFKGEVEDI